jgi:hypothetical protein
MDNATLATPAQVAQALAPAFEYIADQADHVAQLCDRGRVAHVAYDMESTGFPNVPPHCVFRMPRKAELRWAEASDPVCMRFVAGKAPRRLALGCAGGVSCSG